MPSAGCKRQNPRGELHVCSLHSPAYTNCTVAYKQALRTNQHKSIGPVELISIQTCCREIARRPYLILYMHLKYRRTLSVGLK